MEHYFGLSIEIQCILLREKTLFFIRTYLIFHYELILTCSYPQEQSKELKQI